MKKLKLNLGAGGIQAWLAHHVEKVVLAVVVGLVGWFIYAGYRKEGYDRNPADLHTKAVTAETHVAIDTSLTRITSEKRDRFVPYRERVKQSQRPTAAAEYSISPFSPSMFPPTQPRQDPELFAPLAVEVEGFLVAVHEMVEDGDDPYRDDKNAPPTQRAVTTPKKDKDKYGKRGQEIPPTMTPGKKGGRSGGSTGIPTLPPTSGAQSGFEGGQVPGAPGNIPSMLGSTSVSETYIQKYVRGYRPGSSGTTSPAPGPVPGFSGAGLPVGVTRYVVAVKAVLPHQKLVDEFQRAFAEAQGYDPLRDSPRYVYYNVERAEVGADPNAEPAWEAIRVRDAWTRYMQKWAGMLTEVADFRYLDPVLTQPMPPAMMVDPVRLGLHSDVPHAVSAVDAPDESGGPQEGKGGKGKSEGVEDSPDAPPPTNFAGGTGILPPGGEGGQMIPGLPAGGPGRGLPGIGSLAGGPRTGYPGGSIPGVGGGPRGPMPPMGAMQGPGAMPGMAGMSYGAVAETVKYKLIRFFDFDVDPTKQYRYRVRVWIEDPNHPQADEMSPSRKILSTKVTERVKALEEKEKASGRRVYYRMTDWSKPSNPVRLPMPVKFVGGKVLPARTLELRELKISVPTTEPSATVLPVVWDVKRAVDIPGYADAPDDPKNPNEKEQPSAYRGTVLNFKKDARILRPDTLELKLLEKHAFQTNAVVVDLRPGEPIRDGEKKPGERKEPLASAGEILLLDQQGQLIVRHELDDIEDYRKYMFTDEDRAATGEQGPGGIVPPGPGANLEGPNQGGFGELLGGSKGSKARPGRGGKGGG